MGTIIGARGGVLKTHVNQETGYEIIRFGRIITSSVHNVVARAWVANAEHKPEIDHRNRDKTDNRACNLRWVTSSENKQNKGSMITNTSGIKGLSFSKRDNLWCAERRINGIRYRKAFKERSDAEMFLQEIMNSL